MNFWVIVYRSAWVALLLLVLVALVCAFRPRCSQLRERQALRTQLEDTNRQMAAQIRELRVKQQQFFADPTFVERTAREESGMIKSNETLFRLGSETLLAPPPKPAKPAPRGGR